MIRLVLGIRTVMAMLQVLGMPEVLAVAASEVSTVDLVWF
jgi:hypothetical protein